MGVIEAWLTAEASLRAAWIGAVATSLVGIVTVIGALFGISRQLNNDRDQRAKDRRHQAAKDTILAAVAGMTEATQSLAMITDREIDPAEAHKTFMGAMAKINAAGAVASMETVRAGRTFTSTVGPIFAAAKSKRMVLAEQTAGPDDWRIFAFKMLDLQRDLVLPRLHRAIAIVRNDLEIAQDESASILDALSPDLTMGQEILEVAWHALDLHHLVAAPRIDSRPK